MMPVTDPTVVATESSEGVLTLALNRPVRRNALDLATVSTLRRAISGTRAAAIVLASASPGMFCAGADLAIPSSERAQVSRELYRLYEEMLAASIPIVAAVDGPAVGGGAQLAVAADVRVAGPRAWIRFVGPGHGLAVGAWALPSLVGRGRTIDLCLSGRRVEAADALAIGLVDRLADDPTAAAQEIATAWAMLDGDAVARVKAVAGRAAERAAALSLEAEGNAFWDGEGP